jgi:hypothetical protein
MDWAFEIEGKEEGGDALKNPLLMVSSSKHHVNFCNREITEPETELHQAQIGPQSPFQV